MPWLILTFADGSDEVVTYDGEARVNISPERSVAFSTLGLVQVEFRAEHPDPSLDEPALSRLVSRSAVTGEFVSDEEAAAKPDTTVVETVEKPKPKRKTAAKAKKGK